MLRSSTIRSEGLQSHHSTVHMLGRWADLFLTQVWFNPNPRWVEGGQERDSFSICITEVLQSFWVLCFPVTLASAHLPAPGLQLSLHKSLKEKGSLTDSPHGNLSEAHHPAETTLDHSQDCQFCFGCFQILGIIPDSTETQQRKQGWCWQQPCLLPIVSGKKPASLLQTRLLFSCLTTFRWIVKEERA